jgi:hypothetical protein
MSSGSTKVVLMTGPHAWDFFSSHAMFVTSASTFYRSEVKAQWCK